MHPPKTERAPDYPGPLWRVWRCSVIAPESPDQVATLGGWLVDAPGPHAFWRCWLVSIVHLRDMPGQSKPPTLREPGMTHEVISFAIDPASIPDPDAHPRELRLLHPLDFAVQFRASSDALAMRVMHAAMGAVASQNLHPDGDYGYLWAQLLQGTADCIGEGGHPQN